MKDFIPGRVTAASVVPPLAALVLVVLFVGLGFWQLDRADQKRELQASFDDGGEYLEVAEGAAPSHYQRISATGRFINGRQFLIDNMVMDGRLGYYIITPMKLTGVGPLLLVNRGWIAKGQAGPGLPSVEVSESPQTVRGRTGRLPRVGLRPGEALEGAAGWPKRATFPTIDELAAALDREVLPFVLLADPDRSTDLVRRWEPRQIGPTRHLAYAFQWFALAATVIVVTGLVYRKKRGRR